MVLMERMENKEQWAHQVPQAHRDLLGPRDHLQFSHLACLIPKAHLRN